MIKASFQNWIFTIVTLLKTSKQNSPYTAQYFNFNSRGEFFRKQIQLFTAFDDQVCFIRKRSYTMYFRLFVLTNVFLNVENFIFKMQAPRNTLHVEHGSYEIIDDKVWG